MSFVEQLHLETNDSTGRLHKPQRFEFPTQNLFGRNLEPVVEQRGIDRAEVGCELEVSVGEVGQARMRSVKSPLSCRSQREQHRCRAVISSEAPVLRNTSTEF